MKGKNRFNSEQPNANFENPRVLESKRQRVNSISNSSWVCIPITSIFL